MAVSVSTQESKLVFNAWLLVTVGLAASHLGIERIGLVMGLISGGHALGGALGAPLGGVLYDMTGAYTWLWTGSFALSVLAGLMVFTLKDNPDSAGAPVPARGAVH